MQLLINKKFLFLCLMVIYITHLSAQTYPKTAGGSYVFQNDSIHILKKKPWMAAGQSFGINMFVWGFNRFVTNEDFARINFSSIKSNLKTLPVWDTDKFSTNLVAHPYHGSLYFNAARSNGLSFWQSIPVTFGGSLMWEYFMETERPSLNDLLATTFGGVELGEITFRLSDLLIDERTSGAERIEREIVAGLISPIRALNRILSGDAWKRRPYSGKVYPTVPVVFIASIGPRFLAEQEKGEDGELSTNIGFRLNYGDPFDDDYYSPYEWFQFNASIDLFSNQPLINQVSAVGVLWGKNIWEKGNRSLTFGVFQHFDYYDSQIKLKSKKKVSPYKISQAAAIGGGLLYKNSSDVFDIFSEMYVTGIALGASYTDYFFVDERDYNMGSGYSFKGYSNLIYKRKWGLMLGIENYHIFTWKGYEPDLDLSTVDINKINVQGDAGNARLAVFTAQLGYYSHKRWNLYLSTRYFTRQTFYKYHENVDYSTFDVALKLGVIL